MSVISVYHEVEVVEFMREQRSLEVFL